MIRGVPTYLIVTVSAWLSRIAVALVQVISIRVLLEWLGSEQYAIFVLLSALVSWYALADLGIGNSLQNFMSEERASGCNPDKYLALSVFFSGPTLVIISGVLFFFSPYLSAIYLTNFQILDANEKTQIFFVAGIIFLGVGIGNIGYKAWYAQHKGYLSSLVPAFASLAGLGFVLAVMGSQTDVERKLLWGVIAFNLPAAVLSLTSYIGQLSRIPATDWKVSTSVQLSFIKRSLKFWVLNAMVVAVLNVDFIIISQYLSPHDVVLYGIATRIFGFSAFFYTAFYAALWPHFTEVIAKNDWGKLKKYLRNATLFSVSIVIIFTLIILRYSPILMEMLSPKEKVELPSEFVLLLGAYHLVLAWVHGFAIVLQSMSDVKVLIISSLVQGVLSVVFQVNMVHWFGIYGITLGLMASSLLTAAWVCPYRVRMHSTFSTQTTL